MLVALALLKTESFHSVSSVVFCLEAHTRFQNADVIFEWPLRGTRFQGMNSLAKIVRPSGVESVCKSIGALCP
jgi:hypothetical protein